MREYLYAFTAACASTGESFSLIFPYANTQTMQIFLDKLSLEFNHYFIIMQVDQASWHTSKKLIIPENIRLIPQPAGSPETNPTENLWDYIKENDFRNKLFKSINEVEKQLCSSLEKIRNMPDLVKSIFSFPHLNIVYSNAN